MKKLILFLGMICLAGAAFAASNVTVTKGLLGSSLAPVSWTSERMNDFVTINNASGDYLFVQINVSRGDGYGEGPFTGVNVTGCTGKTTQHIDLGSSIICKSADMTSPIRLNADKDGAKAVGTYQVK